MYNINELNKKLTNNEDINIIFEKILKINENIVSTISIRNKKFILK